MYIVYIMSPTNTVADNEAGVEIPSISGPYQTEAFPLKQNSRGRRMRLFDHCCGGTKATSDKGGTSLRIIVMCFISLTSAIIIALGVQIYSGDYQLIPHGSVATDSPNCSIVGTEILKIGGNAVDAAIAATFCLGLTNPHITGLGGGGFMVIYSHRQRRVLDVIDFREAAPASASIASGIPGSTVGVPGILRGLALAHQLYGKLPWKEIVMPTVQIASSGFLVSHSLVQAVKSHLIPNSYSTDFVNWANQLEAGQSLPPQMDLAATLELIADRGPDVFYNGSLTKYILEAVNSAGGNMTAQDLAGYKAVQSSALQATFANFNIFVPGFPSGGPALFAALKLLTHFNYAIESQDLLVSKFVLQVINVSQEIFGRQSWALGYPSLNDIHEQFDLQQSVGSHVAAVDLNDLYVSAVSGLNTWFGSQLRTSGGFLLNNALTNFGEGVNHPGPGKRPVSLATPIIAVENRKICGRRLVLGTSDAMLAVQLLSRLLVLDKNVTLSVEAPRFQVGNQTIYLEDNHTPQLSVTIRNLLRKLGFQLKNLSDPYQSCNLVEKIGDNLASHSDSRGGGVASRF